MLRVLLYVLFFFFNDTATTEIYTLSLHDALPISWSPALRAPPARSAPPEPRGRTRERPPPGAPPGLRDPLASSSGPFPGSSADHARTDAASRGCSGATQARANARLGPHRPRTTDRQPLGWNIDALGAAATRSTSSWSTGQSPRGRRPREDRRAP